MKNNNHRHYLELPVIEEEGPNANNNNKRSDAGLFLSSMMMILFIAFSFISFVFYVQQVVVPKAQTLYILQTSSSQSELNEKNIRLPSEKQQQELQQQQQQQQQQEADILVMGPPEYVEQQLEQIHQHAAEVNTHDRDDGPEHSRHHHHHDGSDSSNKKENEEEDDPNSSGNDGKKKNTMTKKELKAAAAADLNSRIVAFDRRSKIQWKQQKRKEALVVTTYLGQIQITLRPDWSSIESIEYIKSIVDVSKKNSKLCLDNQNATDTQQPKCPNFYRIHKTGIFQGTIVGDKHSPLIPPPPVVKGFCPIEYKNWTYKHHNSKDNESKKGYKECHGPVMTRGQIAWAGGHTGPDFAIDSYDRPTDWWGIEHTVWGVIEDKNSFDVIDKVWSLPTHRNPSGTMTYLNNPISFTMDIVDVSDVGENEQQQQQQQQQDKTDYVNLLHPL